MAIGKEGSSCRCSFISILYSTILTSVIILCKDFMFGTELLLQLVEFFLFTMLILWVQGWLFKVSESNFVRNTYWLPSPPITVTSSMWTITSSCSNTKGRLTPISNWHLEFCLPYPDSFCKATVKWSKNSPMNYYNI